MLLKLHGFKDADLLEDIRFDIGEDKQITWPNLLRTCRNLVQHGGFFDTKSYPQWDDLAYDVYDHLHDITLRVLLRRLGFTHKYQPSTIHVTAQFDLEWVAEPDRLRLLGYQQLASALDISAQQ